MDKAEIVKDAGAVLVDAGKGLLSFVNLKAAVSLAAYEQWKNRREAKALQKMIALLEERLEDVEGFFSDTWYQSEPGQVFAEKVIVSALDGQMAEKQEFFVNALIRGVQQKEIEDDEKLKFIDMLRQLSKLSLAVLAEMHKTLKVGGQINSQNVSVKLANEKGWNPLVIEAAIAEMRSIGLFSSNMFWIKNNDGWRLDRYFTEGTVGYTEFSARFIEFIKDPR